MKLKSKIGTVIAMSVLFMASCSNPPAAVEAPKAINMDSLKVKIQAMEDAFSAAEKAKDAGAVAEYYSDDAISYGRNKEPLVGKEAIKASIAERMTSDTTNYTNVYKVVDLFAEGNMVVEIGSWQDMDSTGTEVSHGHYLSYFQNRDGKYVCVRDMNVTSMPVKK
jgi:ketosteroid isomerase-like protein